MGHKFTRTDRSVGGRNSLALHPELKALHARYLRHDSESQSSKALKRIEGEKRTANRLAEWGWTVYFPTVVCDRIGVKDGKVFFLEFKKGNQPLRPGQQAIRSLVPNMYKVIREW